MTATRVWLLLIALTLASVAIAERAHFHALAISAMFMLAAAKAELVIAHYMEVGHARPHWRFAYRAWIAAVTMMMIAGISSVDRQRARI